MNYHGTESVETPHSSDELLTLEEVASLVRVPIATVRYWRAQGHGPRGFRVGRCVRYWRADVILWLDSQADCAPDRESRT